jgi:hypothetical protein
VVEQFDLTADTIKRRRFLARLRDEITRRGIIDVLRKGIRHSPAAVSLSYGTPTPGNVQAAERYAANVFSVIRQLHYSKDEGQLSLDLCLFINGLPAATFELKNNLTKQTVEDAVQQYKRDRDPRELIFQFGRCLVHFALDDQEVRMCTHLQSDASWFLPFNKGWNDGAGNPPNPHGLKTDYLWKEVLTPSYGRQHLHRRVHPLPRQGAVHHRLAGAAQQLSNLHQVGALALVGGGDSGTDDVHLWQRILQRHQVAHVLAGGGPPHPGLQVKHVHRCASAHEAGPALSAGEGTTLERRWLLPSPVVEPDVTGQASQCRLQQFGRHPNHLRLPVHWEASRFEADQGVPLRHAKAHLLQDLDRFLVHQLSARIKHVAR